MVGHIKNKVKETFLGGKSRAYKFLSIKLKWFLISALYVCIFHILGGSIYVCVCTNACVCVLLFVYTNQSKMIDSRKWSMIGNTFFYFKKEMSCFHNYSTGVEVLTWRHKENRCFLGLFVYTLFGLVFFVCLFVWFFWFGFVLFLARLFSVRFIQGYVLFNASGCVFSPMTHRFWGGVDWIFLFGDLLSSIESLIALLWSLQYSPLFLFLYFLNL